MKKYQSGFTLIEIAIVLVIIGLLLGGVLKGQELINSAKVRSLNNRIDGIAAAWFGFQDRYRAMPGDMLLADAQANIDAAVTKGGDADGTVDTNAERGAIWEQLSLAGFITGSYDAADIGSVFTCPVGTCPDNGYGVGFLVTLDNESQGLATTGMEMFTGNNIPSEILAELDRKIDDGATDAGVMRSADGGGGAVNAAACQNGSNYALGVDRCAAVIRNL